MGGRIAILGWVALSGSPWAAVAQDAAPPAVPAPPVAPQKPQTVQQLFEAAAAASEAGDDAGAVALFTQLEARTKSARNLSIIRVRKAIALLEMGRKDDARALLEQAVPALPRDDETLRDDRLTGLRALGRIAVADLDYETAQHYYAQATSEAVVPVDQIAGLLGGAQAATFIDPALALRHAQDSETVLTKEPGLSRKISGQIAMVKGRALLNLGRFVEAEKSFESTVKAEGGLSMRVDYDDLVARSDASIAAMLAGHRDKAREYLLYTGAGRMAKQDFTQGADMALPVCGEDGIKPDDVAVVEFGIADSGAVSYARPIYGSRPGGMALVFARAVTGWSWRPDGVAKIPPLFRFVTRLELRCSAGEGGPSLQDGLIRAFDEWAQTRGATFESPASDSEARNMVATRAELARIRAIVGDDSMKLAPVLAALLRSPLVTATDIRDYGALLRALAAKNGAPPLARLEVDLLAIDMAGQKPRRELLPPETAYRDDPEALATLRLLGYDILRQGEKGRNIALLDAIIADPALSADHPLHVAALTRRASAKAAAGDLDGARADFVATKLTEQQCSIVDAKPNLHSSSISSYDYPMDMVQAGVEGWSRVQFDIGADGRTLNQRAIVTYPAMIFSNASVKMLTGARFDQSYRPSGGLGCGASGRTIIFQMPS